MTTPTSRIQTIVNKFRSDLLAKEAQAEQVLNTAHAHTLATIQPKLNKLYDEIAEKMAAGEKIPQSWVYERLRLENIQLLIQGQIDNYSAVALQQTRMNQHLGAQLGQQSGMQQLQATVPHGISYTFGIPSTKAINNLVGATQAGSPLSDLFNGWGKEAATKASQALINGVTLGNNPRVVARDVQKALGISKQRALITARNEMLRCYKSANLETYRANDDVVETWVWSASMSTRTCLACILLNGTEHPLSEEMASHVCCRCSPVPKTKSWSDILGPLGISTDSIQETSISLPSGHSWFNDQDESTQRAIMGDSMYEAWNSGKFDLSDAIGYDHDDDWGTSVKVKPLKELVKK